LDRTFLNTLPKRHLLNGVCEIIKLAVIKDVTLFELLESHGAECVELKFQDEIGASILERAVGGMLEELQPNLFEEELARKVDFGHTFSYGFETVEASQLLHGEAVLLDIVISSILARARNLLTKIELNRLFELIAKLGIVLNSELVKPELLWKTLQERTYHRNGMQRVPLPDGLGNCLFANDIKFEEIKSACKTLENWMEVNDTIYEY